MVTNITFLPTLESCLGQRPLAMRQTVTGVIYLGHKHLVIDQASAYKFFDLRVGLALMP